MRLGRCLSILIVSALPSGPAFSAANPPPAARPDAGRLVRALSGDDAVARFLAEEQLIRMGDRALPALGPLATAQGFTPARQYAIHLLGRIRSQRAARLLVRILDEDRDVRVRGLVCQHVGRLGVKAARPIIERWLLTIRGKAFGGWRGQASGTPLYGWVRHVHALRQIGSERSVPVLERMLERKHGGPGGGMLMRAYRENLAELRREAAFWKAVRRVRGLERHVNALFGFFRTDDLARIRLYRNKVVRLEVEGRWVLEGMRRHPDATLRAAAAALLGNYEGLRRTR